MLLALKTMPSLLVSPTPYHALCINPILNSTQLSLLGTPFVFCWDETGLPALEECSSQRALTSASARPLVPTELHCVFSDIFKDYLPLYKRPRFYHIHLLMVMVTPFSCVGIREKNLAMGRGKFVTSVLSTATGFHGSWDKAFSIFYSSFEHLASQPRSVFKCILTLSGYIPSALL